LLKLNTLINNAYECFSFEEFLKLSIVKLHELVMYDSGMFFCAISKDSSFFKPYIGGNIEAYYKKQNFPEREQYLSQAENSHAGSEALVYKSVDYSHGVVQVNNEPRRAFLSSQIDFNIACMRIIHKGQFLGEIYLHRGKDKPDFDDEDLFILRLLQPHVSTVFSMIHTIIAVKYLETNQETSARKGICLFDRELSLTGGNVTGIEMLKVSTVFGSSVLYHIKEMCADLLNDEATKSSANALLYSTLLKTAKGDMQIDIFVKNDRKRSKNLQFVAVMEFCNEEQSTGDYKFKFTRREADIIDGLIQGKNNSQLAKALSLSQNTIKTHIQSIYKKTGANNRTELTYILMLNQK
ncbi:MAG: helix-turn-helix transcriptional regulator, partial [Desulfitobacteriaceae bacterium]